MRSSLAKRRPHAHGLDAGRRKLGDILITSMLRHVPGLAPLSVTATPVVRSKGGFMASFTPSRPSNECLFPSLNLVPPRDPCEDRGTVILRVFLALWIVGCNSSSPAESAPPQQSTTPQAFSQTPTAPPSPVALRPQITNPPPDSGVSAASQASAAFEAWRKFYKVTASELASEYEANEIAAERKYKGKPIELFGIVQTVRRSALGSPVVNFNIDHPLHYVRCDFDEGEATELADLEPDQLVAVHGTGGTLVMGSPHLESCELVWTGFKPSAKASNDDRSRWALIAARSAELCLPQVFDLVGQRDKLVGKEKARVEGMMKKLVATARADIEKLNATPLPCPHPLMAREMLCEETRDKISECRVAEIREMIRQMQKK